MVQNCLSYGATLIHMTNKIFAPHDICSTEMSAASAIWSGVSGLSILLWVLSFQVITLITCFNVSVLQVSRIVYFNTIQTVMIWGSYQLQIESQKSKHTRICSISIWTNCILVSSVLYSPLLCSNTKLRRKCLDYCESVKTAPNFHTANIKFNL